MSQDGHGSKRQQKKHMPWHEAHHQQETLRFVLVSVLDIFMTYILLVQPGGQFVESNPIARYFIYGWGVKGMVGFKLSMTGLVCVISQVVASHRPRTAKWLLNGATIVVAAVVVYSLGLFLRSQALI